MTGRTNDLCRRTPTSIHGWSLLLVVGTVAIHMGVRYRATLPEWVGQICQQVLWRGPRGEYLIDHPFVGKPHGASVKLVNNPTAKDPTHAELLEFLRRDLTDQHPYKVNEFTCVCFAEEVHNNAELAGISCALVTIDLPAVAHALNAFHTTDRGLIYIDCTNSIQSVEQVGPASNDRCVEFNQGDLYIPKFLYPSHGWADSCSSMGRVRNIRIFW